MTIAPLLTTDRLLLAPLSLAHWEDYAAAWADPQLTAFIGGQPRTRQESWTKFTQAVGLWPLLGFGYWAFVARDDGRFLGNGGLARFERGIPELEGFPEAGWAFVPAAWGQGLATEAMAAILHWADAQLGDEIRCIIDPGNRASQRVADKLGFAAFAQNDGVLGPVQVYRRPAPAGPVLPG
ncbi:MAG: GNAT family N-acetyltransferase [Chakrabartia sp.]